MLVIQSSLCGKISKISLLTLLTISSFFFVGLLLVRGDVFYLRRVSNIHRVEQTPRNEGSILVGDSVSILVEAITYSDLTAITNSEWTVEPGTNRPEWIGGNFLHR